MWCTLDWLTVVPHYESPGLQRAQEAWKVALESLLLIIREGARLGAG